MTRILATLSLILLAAACYTSARGTGDMAEDPAPDTTPDPPADLIPDFLPDAQPDPRPDPIDEPAEPDVPPPRYGVTFVIENASPESCSSCIYYLAFSILDYAIDSYGLAITWNEEYIIWEMFYCMLACEDLPPDPVWCCVDCYDPLPAVKQLAPGESVSVAWNGSVFTFDMERCYCGCYLWDLAPAGSGRAAVCAFQSYTCSSDEECLVDDDGVIFMAEGAGEPLCVETDFSFPADDGGEVFLRIR